MPTRICLEPSCPNSATYRGRCATHARQHDKQINRAGHKLYRTAKWKRIRERFLAENPLCQCDDPTCFEIATDVHHRVDLEDGGAPWAFSNLQSLAHACHSRITRRHQDA